MFFPMRSIVAKCLRPVGLCSSLLLIANAFSQQRSEFEPTPVEDAARTIYVREGYELQLVAAEPLTKDPVAIDWDNHGRLWVAEMADYPLGIDGKGKPGGRVRTLVDENNDGVYDRSTLFLDGLNFPTGIMCWKNGVLITAAPELIYAEDTDADGKADIVRTLFEGFNQGNQQLRMNGLRWGLDNWIYCANGGHHAGHGTNIGITCIASGVHVALGSRDFRFRPDEGLLDPQSGPSQFGRNRDAWGNWFGVQNSYPLWHYVLEDHYIRRNPFFAPPNPRHNLTESNPRLYPRKQPQKRFHSYEHSIRFTSACSGIVYRDNLLFDAFTTLESREPQSTRPSQTELQHSFTCAPFHSLVQHNVLREEGTSFNLTRDPAEIETEFFASTDRWCRPVMVRTGPDGAIWVVDMYRYMIEHPEWVNDQAKEELRPYYRHGEEYGRIYRVVRKADAGAESTRKVPVFSSLSTTELVVMLSHPNGWVRDRVQQLLIWKQDANAIEPLRRLVFESKSSFARLHAICTLDGFAALDESTLVRALTDADPAVRRHAIRLTEKFANPSEQILALIESLTNDSNAKVRMQLASSIGEYNDARFDSLLAKLIFDAGDDPYLLAAAMSSVTKNSALPILDQLMPNAEPSIVQSLFRSALAFDKRSAIQIVTKRIVELTQNPPRQFELLAKLLDVADFSQFDVSFGPIIKQAETVALDVDANPDHRVKAIGLVARESELNLNSIEVARTILSAQNGPRIHHAMITRLAARSEPMIAELLIGSWRGFTPTLRTQVANALLLRASSTKIMLDGIESNTIAASEIDAPVRQRLFSLKDDAQVQRAKNLLSESTSSDRQATIAEFLPALKLEADKIAGRKVFETKCGTCHRHDGLGHELGPNLAALTDKSGEAYLTSILDPSRAVEAKFLNYIVQTVDGRTLSGIITSETGANIVLQTNEAKMIPILRSEIEELASTGKSLMPDGLEKELTLQNMADLIKFLSQ